MVAMLKTSSLLLWTLVGLGYASSESSNLNLAARTSGKYFGTATNVDVLADPAYHVLVSSTGIFGQLTPEKEMKWSDTEPQRGVFDFSPADIIVAQAKANGQIIRCHTLIWSDGLPDWVTDYQGSSDDLIDVIRTHVYTIVNHFKGDCYSWDVVNEALNDDGTYRRNVFLDTLGPAYIAIAFEAAAMADPDAKLYYNDYNIDNIYGVVPEAPSAHPRRSSRRQRARFVKRYTSPKIEAAMDIVNMIRQKGARIDGVGLQGHYTYNYTSTIETLTSIMNDFTDMDLDVAITELDIRMNLEEINTYTEAVQAQGFANVMIACRNVARCVGVTLWGFTDKYSWVSSVFPSEGSADPWDDDLRPKEEILKAIMEAWEDGSYGNTHDAD